MGYHLDAHQALLSLRFYAEINSVPYCVPTSETTEVSVPKLKLCSLPGGSKWRPHHNHP